MNSEKSELRRQCKNTRQGMSLKMVSAGSQAVCDNLSEWVPFKQASTVLSFLAFRNEIDLSSLFERWPEKRWLVPRVVEGAELEPAQRPYLVLHPYEPTRLVRHRFGMLEPQADLAPVDPDEVDLILVPGVAFDLQGGRLGFGGGYYDRLLPLASRGIRIGVTFENLVLDAIPMEPWDCRVEWLVTPSRLIKTRHQ